MKPTFFIIIGLFLLSCNNTPAIPKELLESEERINSELNRLMKHTNVSSSQEASRLQSDLRNLYRSIEQHTEEQKKAGVIGNNDELLGDIKERIELVGLDEEKYRINDRMQWMKEHDLGDDLQSLKNRLDHLTSLRNTIQSFQSECNQKGVNYQGMDEMAVSINLQITGITMQIEALKAMEESNTRSSW